MRRVPTILLALILLLGGLAYGIHQYRQPIDKVYIAEGYTNFLDKPDTDPEVVLKLYLEWPYKNYDTNGLLKVQTYNRLYAGIIEGIARKAGVSYHIETATNRDGELKLNRIQLYVDEAKYGEFSQALCRFPFKKALCADQ